MKKVSTAAAMQTQHFQEQQLTIGLDLGDRSSWYCVLDATGGVLLEQRLSTTPKAMKEVFGGSPGLHAPAACGHKRHLRAMTHWAALSDITGPARTAATQLRKRVEVVQATREEQLRDLVNDACPKPAIEMFGPKPFQNGCFGTTRR